MNRAVKIALIDAARSAHAHGRNTVEVRFNEPNQRFDRLFGCGKTSRQASTRVDRKILAQHSPFDRRTAHVDTKVLFQVLLLLFCILKCRMPERKPSRHWLVSSEIVSTARSLPREYAASCTDGSANRYGTYPRKCPRASRRPCSTCQSRRRYNACPQRPRTLDTPGD